jgi:hypothetical protein
MTEIMKARIRNTWPNIQMQSGNQGMKRLADGAWINRPAPTQAEQRCFIPGCTYGPAPTYMLYEQRSKLGAEGDKTALIKLGFPDNEQSLLEVDVPDAHRQTSPTRNPSPYRTAKRMK